MKHKAIFILISFFLLIGFTAATGYSIDLDNEATLNGENYHYSVTSIPTYEGLSAIETSSLESQCSNLRTVTWDGDSGETESDTVYSTKGYVFLAPQDCDISIDSEDYVDESAPSLSEGWNIISTGSGVMFDEAQGELSSCQVPSSNVHSNRKKLYKIGLEGSSTVMQMTESLEFSRAYWVEVEEECDINQGNSENSVIKPPEDGDTDSEEDSKDDGHSHQFGDIYFYDTEGEVTQMNTEAENDYDGQTVEYDMYDNSIEGYFGWNNLDEVEHTLWVRNEETGESRSTTTSSDEITVPPSTTGETFSTTEGGFYELSSDQCTSFNIGVLPPEWDGTDSDVSGDAEQFNQFTLCPDSAQDDSDERESVTKSSGGYTFEVTPPPNDIATDDDVSLTVTESGEDADLSNKRIKFALNGIAGYLPNDPYTTVECSDSECSATITSDRIEGEPGTVDARVDERRRTQTGYDWRPFESVSWDVD